MTSNADHADSDNPDSFAESPSTNVYSHSFRRETRLSRGAAYAVVALIVGLIGIRLLPADIGRISPTRLGAGEVVEAPTIVIKREAGVKPGRFVWPAPNRSFASVIELVDQFAIEVMDWDPADISHDTPDDVAGPLHVEVTNLASDLEVELFAVPSPDGWGFLSVGNRTVTIEVPQPNLPESGRHTIYYDLPKPDSTQFVEVRYSTDEITTESTTNPWYSLPTDRAPQTVISILIKFVDTSGSVLDVVGFQFEPIDSQVAEADQ